MGDIGYGMSGSYWRQLQVAPHPRGARFTGRLECATSSQGSTRFCVATVVRPWRSTQSCLPSLPSASSSRSALSVRLDQRRARHGHGRDLDPVRSRAHRPRLLPARCTTREAPDRRLSLFSGGAYCRDGRRAPPDVSQPARRRGARADGRGDPERRRGRSAGAGAGRDGDRAARPPAARRVVPRALQRAARLHRAARAGRRQGRRRLRRQLPARTAVGERAAHALRPAHRRAAGGDRCRRAHRHAHRSGHRARRARARAAGIARARPHRRARHRLLERAPARPPVRARRDPHPLAAAREPRGLRRAARARPRASRAPCATTGSPSCAAPTSSSRPRGSSDPSRCCSPSGSSPARWSCPTAR